MELRHLRYFVAVAELGSVSRAAVKLFIAQPPLSTQIRQLEDEIGTTLLLRHPRGVRLTPAGKTFLDEARDLLARADRAKRLARQTDNAAGGLIRMGYVPSAGHTVLPKLVLQLRALRPQIEIEVREMVTAQQIEALQQHQIDLGFVRPPADTARVALVQECSDPFCLVVPNGHALMGDSPVDLRQAAQSVFVSVTRHRGPAFFDQIVGLCTDVAFNPDIRYEASTIYGVMELVSAGLGVALLPASGVLISPKGITFRMLKRATRPGTLALAHLRDDANPLLPDVLRLTQGIFRELRSEVKKRIATYR